jgi:hypothetical protein
MCHQSGSDTCQAGFNCVRVNLLMCVAWCDATCVAMWQGMLKWPYHQLPHGILVGPTSWLTSLVWGPHVPRWPNRCVPRGTCLLTWFILVLPRGTSSLICYFIYLESLVPSLYPKRPLSPSCTQSCLDQISALDQFI